MHRLFCENFNHLKPVHIFMFTEVPYSALRKSGIVNPCNVYKEANNVYFQGFYLYGEDTVKHLEFQRFRSE